MEKIDALTNEEYEGLLKPIYDFLVINNIPKKAEAIFIFGSVRLKSVWSQALKLYQQGYADVILVTGNVGVLGTPDYPANKNISEAEQISRYLIEKGVPESVIIKESKATNTLENVHFGIAALKKGGVNPQSLILVAKPGHMIRCVATFKKQCPEIELVCCPPMGTIHDFIDRPKKEFAERTIGEIERLQKYADKGDIVKMKIPQEVLDPVVRIREYIA